MAKQTTEALPEPNEFGIITRLEIARGLKCSERTFWRIERAGEGPPRVFIGKKPFYLRSAVEAWIASRQIKSVKGSMTSKSLRDRLKQQRYRGPALTKKK